MPYFRVFESKEDFVCKFAILRAIFVNIFNGVKEGEERGRGGRIVI